MSPHHDPTEFPEPTYKEAAEGWQRCQAENARLQARVEEAEAWEGERDSYIKEFDKTCKERDGYKALAERRGEALEPLARCAEDCPPKSPDHTILYDGAFVSMVLGDARRARAAIDISPEEARERR